jgi:peptidoglycan hydrolase CwlO-like protein
MIEKIAFKIIQWIGSVSSLIIHTILFTSGFLLYFSNIFDKNTILLIITLIVSLEAIYLSIFIQMSVNSQSKKLQDVAENVEDISENVEDIQENVEDIQESVDEDDDEEDEDIKEIQSTLNKLMKEVVSLKRKAKS